MRRVLVGIVVLVAAAGCAAPGVVGAATAVPIGEQPYLGPFATPSPLGEALDGSDAEPDVAQLQADDAAVQASVVACMAGRGFTYLPVTYDASSYSLDVDPGYPDLTRQQFAETYGFGISTADQLPDTGAYSDYAVAAEDPNAVAYEAMDDATRLAWDTALYGDLLSDAGAVAAVPSDGTGTAELVAPPQVADVPDAERGCLDLAYDASLPDLQPVAGLAAAEDALAALEAQVAADPRTVTATGDYTVCMRAAGYELDGVDAAWNDASDRLYSASGDDVLGTMSDDEYDALTDDERAALEAESTPDPAALAALQAQEIDEAVADLRCLGPSEPALVAVRAELENAFIATHGSELELLRQAYGG